MDLGHIRHPADSLHISSRPELPRRSSQSEPRRRSSPPDYGEYIFTRQELTVNVIIFIVIDLTISWLFYHSLLVALIFLPILPYFLKSRKNTLMENRKREMLKQFTTAMQLVNSSLQAGYAVENAFREALHELGKIYPRDSFIIREFLHISSQISNSVPIESILMDLSDRSHIEDIRNFAEVFRTAKRSGGNMMLIIRNTVSSIQSKTETWDQIQADVSGKVMEQKVMSLMPVLIIAYVSISSPDFLQVCYSTLAGRLVMTMALLIYAAAYLWGKHVMKIEV